MPFTLSHQNPTCQVTSTHYSLKEGESHIQKTRTHFKTGQAILWEDFFPPLSTEVACATKGPVQRWPKSGKTNPYLH